MSKQYQEIIFAQGETTSTVLNNTGGPSSRVRTEEIKSSFLKNKNVILTSEIIGLILPPQNIDFENWVLGLGKCYNWNSWQEINQHILLPSEKLLVQEVDANELVAFYSAIEFDYKRKIRSAIILSMCSQSHYLPESTRIYTRKRLVRIIKLIKIDINKFYELD